MDFSTVMVLFGLTVAGMCLLFKMSASDLLAYQVSVLKRLRRGLCGLLGLVFAGTGLCMALGYFGLIDPELGSRAATVGVVLLGVLIVDVLRFNARKPPVPS